MIAIKKPSFLSASPVDTKKESTYSTIPLNTKNSDKNILNASLIFNTLLTKMSNIVARTTLLETINTMSVQLVSSMIMAIFAARRIPPMDKISDFMCLNF